VNRLCSELAETDEFEKTGFVNVNVRPYYAEGSKTLGFEVAEQLGWRLPGQYLAPMASGSMLTKIHKSFKELVAAGLVPASSWKVYGAQSGGLLADRDRVRQRLGRRPAGQADWNREVAQHREPGGWAVRAGRRALDRWRDGSGERRGDPRRQSACSPVPPASSPRRPAA